MSTDPSGVPAQDPTQRDDYLAALGRAAQPPGGVDCRAVVAEVGALLDGELTEGRVAQLREHLDACGPCLREADLEERVKSLVARCCGGDTAPPALRDRVLTTIRVTVTETVVVEG